MQLHERILMMAESLHQIGDECQAQQMLDVKAFGAVLIAVADEAIDVAEAVALENVNMSNPH